MFQAKRGSNTRIPASRAPMILENKYILMCSLCCRVSILLPLVSHSIILCSWMYVYAG